MSSHLSAPPHPSSSHFDVTLTFHDYTDLSTAAPATSFISETLTSSQPLALTSWDASFNDTDALPSGGVALGCQDGSIFIWKPTVQEAGNRAPSVLSLTGQASPSQPMSRDSLATSRSASPAASNYAAPFQFTTRSRVVSGITVERVEAPKNFVDFDDEPDKLKDMLKGRNPRDRAISSASAADKPSAGESQRSKALEGLFSPTPQSPPHTPNVISFSPLNQPMGRLRPLSHTLLSAAGPRSSVISMHLIDHGDLLAVLQRSGRLTILTTSDGRCAGVLDLDHTLLDPPEDMKPRKKLHDAWNWERLTVHQSFQRTLVIASASLDSNSLSSQASDMQEDESQDECRTVVVELSVNRFAGNVEITLEAIGQWYLEGPPDAIGLHFLSDDMPTFFYINATGQLNSYDFAVLPYSTVRTKSSGRETPDSQRLNVNLANPFKAVASKPSESSEHQQDEHPGRISLQNLREIGSLPFDNQIMGCRMLDVGGSFYGLVWSLQELVIFTYNGGVLQIRFKSSFVGIQDARLFDDRTFIIVYEDKFEHYELKTVNEDNDEISQFSPDQQTNFKPNLLHTIATGGSEALDIRSRSTGLIAPVKDGRFQLESIVWDEKDRNQVSQIVWRAPVKTSNIRLTASLPIDLNTILLGYSDGRVRQTSLMQICRKRSSEAVFSKVSDQPLDGYIVCLQEVRDLRTNDRLIMGGADDGSIAIWSISDLKLCARWTVLNTPLSRILQFQDIKNGPLRGCVLCVAEDGTIAVVAIDGFKFLYIVPGSAFPLERVCIGQNNLLLMYSDSRARLWDIKTKEFWRSMTSDKAKEMLAQGGWSELLLNFEVDSSGTMLSTVANATRGLDFASTLCLNVKLFISTCTSIAKSISTSKSQTQKILQARDHLRAVLSTLLTPGLNRDIDEICRVQLGIPLSNVSVGFSGSGCSSTYQVLSAGQAWTISHDISAARALGITVTLRALSVFEELSQSASTVIGFYTSSLSGAVGVAYKPPSLVFIARCWLDGSNEVRQAARILFDATAAGMTDDETNTMVDAWQHQLPFLQPTIQKESLIAALALFLCGHLAAERYSLLSASTMKDISKSISLYLHDEHSIHRVLAVDLCSRGFQVWQHYIDALEILRSLVVLATSTRKETISAQNVGAQARLAILHISVVNTTLFMTTLSLDILNPTDTEHKKSVMQILAFLIRKRPMVLYPNIPKLMEAVVKSLDPNSTTNRDAILDTATEIIGQVVKTFPNTDFHMSTQRLAVGSNEGAIVMYDLKTAIRLYVLEGHKKSITACSFSPDGRRLVTMSLEESVVLVWKVGSSFTSFFNPGAPPRQGHSGSDPFKTLPFNIGDEGNMNIVDTLELVKFEWPADRSVKLKIRGSVLTFST
ncbi:WD40 repeat-like protein [Marasmius fiardii PR-910]|nr:WD40 repeat-like protein [Marasmius fiardii PR-910]